ncbi:MAG: alpha/beta fold hydrolase [Candidatus Aminicenantes bacterium]|nr:alpha/beta fold hydrolase [Candidatus Aminicenantes bacterium]
MKKRLGILVLIALFSLNMNSQQKSPYQMDELISMAKSFVEAMEKGDYEEAVKNFDETMTKLAPPEKMKQVWETLISQVGELKQQKEVRTESLPKYDVVYITCEFEKWTLDVKVVFNKKNQIAGQFFIPPPAPYQPPDYADRSTFVEKEVEFGVKGWELPGILSLPKGEGPFPAVVLVHGSGPNDRDESVGANKPFKDLAWGLASQKIAVLRYDKRTKVHGSKMVSEKSIPLTVFEESIEDALHAAHLLRTTERIDPEHIYILGHSLGGTLIPRIAPLDQRASGFIVMAGATRPFEDLYIEQVRYIFRLDGKLTGDEESMLKEIKSEVQKIKDLKQTDLSRTDQKLLGAHLEYWLNLKGYKPAETAKKMTRPLLILQGGRDYQVTEKDFQNWKDSLSSQKNVTFKLYPSLNHLFISGEGPSSPSEYQNPGHVDEKVIQDIATWIHTFLCEDIP